MQKENEEQVFGFFCPYFSRRAPIKFTIPAGKRECCKEFSSRCAILAHSKWLAYVCGKATGDMALPSCSSKLTTMLGNGPVCLLKRETTAIPVTAKFHCWSVAGVADAGQEERESARNPYCILLWHLINTLCCEIHIALQLQLRKNINKVRRSPLWSSSKC